MYSKLTLGRFTSGSAKARNRHGHPHTAVEQQLEDMQNGITVELFSQVKAIGIALTYVRHENALYYYSNE